MNTRIGYLLPTREQIMQGQPETGRLLRLAAEAAEQGFDSIWVGDSVTARPRHDPLTLLAAVAGRLPQMTVGTAVLLPALRNPVLLAHQVATLDQLTEGKLILGVGFASDNPPIRAEFEACGVPFDKRVGRMMQGLRLCQALWSGQPVSADGLWRLEKQTVGPTPCRPGGPPLWIGGNLPASLERAGKHFDGWFPNAPAPADYADKLAQIRATAQASGRDRDAVTGAMYLTITLDDDRARADERMNQFLANYYGQRADTMRKRQVCYAGPAAELPAWLDGYVQAGVTHMCLRFAGDHDLHLKAVGRILNC